MLVELRPFVIHFIDFMHIKEVVFDHLYDLAAVIMVCETMKAADLSAVSPLLAAQQAAYDFVGGVVSLLLSAENSDVTVLPVHH